MKNNNYIRHMPYLRNSIGYDHDFWYTCVLNDEISRFFFHFYELFIFWTVRVGGGGARGKRAKKSPK